MDVSIIWLIAGIALILSELLLTSIIAVFFGVSALIVAALLHFGIIESYTTQTVVFSVVSALLLAAARRRVSEWFTGDDKQYNAPENAVSQFLGETATVVSDFQDGTGRVNLNGSHWTAMATQDFKVGQRVRIVKNDSITLFVEAV